MLVPHDRLSVAALAAVIEEYVTRDGTEQSEAAVKAARVRRALDDGELMLVYDAESETCNIVTPDEAQARLQAAAEAASEFD